MLKESFIFLDKIGPKTERNIWDQGIGSWGELDAKPVKGISKSRLLHYNRRLAEAQAALERGDHSLFSRSLKAGDHFRCYDDFKDKLLYLDIETAEYYGYITVIGLYDGENVKTLVRGYNLDRYVFRKAIEDFKVLVTFNGRSFDIPVIERLMGPIPEMIHIDLRFVCDRIGLRGGLKRIEQELGISRPNEIKGVVGSDAVYLWEQYRATGKERYLEKLIAYNTGDIVNLKPLSEHAIPELWRRVRGQVSQSL